MHNRAFHSLKRTFMNVSGLPPPNYDFFKKKYNIYWFFFSNQNMVGEDVGISKTCVSGLETHVYACLRSSTTIA